MQPQRGCVHRRCVPDFRRAAIFVLLRHPYLFSTMVRQPALHDRAFLAEMHSYLSACAKTLSCLPIQIGGVSDHVFLLTCLAPTISIAEFVKELKRSLPAGFNNAGECSAVHAS